MDASRTCMMLCLLPLCAGALLLSPASAEPAVPGPVAGDDTWPADSPAEAPVAAVALTLEVEEDKQAADVIVADDGIALPPGRQRFRQPHHHAALSPEARRGLDHEVRCGPRVPVRPGFPWPGRNPRCRDGDSAAAGAPDVRPLFPMWNP